MSHEPVTDEEQPLVPSEANKLCDDHTPFKRPTTRRGYLYAAVGSLFFCAGGILFHVSETRLSVPPLTSVLLMGLIYLPCSVLPLLLLQGRAGLQLSRRTLGWLALRGLFGAVSVTCIIQAFATLPTGDVSSIFFTAPVFTMLLAIPLAAELPTCAELCAASAALLGALLIACGDRFDAAAHARPDSLPASLAAGAGALTGAMGYAVARKLGTGVHYLLHTAAMGLGCLLAGLFFGGARGVGVGRAAGADLSSSVLLLPVAASAIGWFGHVAVHRGVQISRAGATLVVRNIEIPLLYIVSAVVLNEVPGLLQICGATLIVTASIATAFMKIETDEAHG